MHGLRYNYPAAEKNFEQAIRVAPNKTEALVIASQHCRDFNSLFHGRELPKACLGSEERISGHRRQLAEVYERLRRSNEAASLVERALQSDAACAPALLLRARLERQSGLLETAEKTLRTFPTQAEPTLRAERRI